MTPPAGRVLASAWLLSRSSAMAVGTPGVRRSGIWRGVLLPCLCLGGRGNDTCCCTAILHQNLGRMERGWQQGSIGFLTNHRVNRVDTTVVLSCCCQN
ncbi:hypothetical protein PF005_g32992 [Phytophthora fragariae]|uniref:Secreted protein n=1 Tax=Phytophthora fragariae TaxID=53985 RepID=A0A6A3UZW7_9STRA|nr:hypothetical protein PF010_g32613 [Phytophthora fragariae]KAE9157025.1 hypothetical protein PF005_g32992 [Phytophthora fragariae]KAE9157146.1 hypothetical protein PF004_g32336 [Phytophthora fragariae]